MCPACIATAALILGSAISTGGMAAFAVKKFQSKNAAEKIAAQNKGKENHDGQHQD
jgi:nitrous oxide reductase accessory protein NosL